MYIHSSNRDCCLSCSASCQCSPSRSFQLLPVAGKITSICFLRILLACIRGFERFKLSVSIVLMIRVAKFVMLLMIYRAYLAKSKGGSELERLGG